eukprot:TRINITY_DN10971_c0_g2_i1.p3 TRINITY_DN10971_c0_g2~~TRINITY_DN10971_c0_g2_i1.p3  ORF type:complete len:106 (+),score=18.35 TRINITY_DN10971_c0_g2_i1:235-552(+)
MKRLVKQAYFHRFSQILNNKYFVYEGQQDDILQYKQDRKIRPAEPNEQDIAFQLDLNEINIDKRIIIQIRKENIQHGLSSIKHSLTDHQIEQLQKFDVYYGNNEA